MTIDKVLAAVANNRSLWVELECPDVAVPAIGGLTPSTDPLHCTLVFCGKRWDPDAVRVLGNICAGLVIRLGKSFRARIGGVARFRGNAAEGDPVVWLLSNPLIREARQYVVDHMKLPPGDWDYTPHVTLGRIPRESMLTVGNLAAWCPPPIEFKSIAICAGEDRYSYPL